MSADPTNSDEPAFPPVEPGWYWWREDQGDSWRVLQIIGDHAKPGSLLDTIAKKHGATPSQIALAWTLKRSPVMLPIPGTSKVAHLEENVAAADITLSNEEFAALDREGNAHFRR